MKTYKDIHPNEATPIQLAKLTGIAKRETSLDEGTEHLRGSESDLAHFVSVGREDATKSELIRIAKPGSGLESGDQTAAERGAYERPITRDAASAVIELAKRQQ